jgi:integrase
MSNGRGLFEVAVEKMRTLHFAYRTERAYLSWIRRYVKFHKRRHPREMGAAEIESFLSHLAVDSHVSASTQNQALQALFFLYQRVLEALRLRIKDLVLQRGEIIVRDAKGGKNRMTVLPTSILLYTHVLGKGAMGVKSPLDRPIGAI